MSYFDENYNGGDGSDDENKNSGSESDTETETETETNIDENEVEEDEDEDVAQGKDTDDDDEGEEDVENVEDKKNYKKRYGVDFGSDDDDAEPEEQDGDEEKAMENEPGSDNEPDIVAPKKKTKKLPNSKPKASAMLADEEDEDEDPTGEVYLQKFDKEINDNYLVNFHPESVVHNYDEILAMTKVIRDKNGIIIDDLHKTIPYLTKYEKARILGQRAKQINSGASVFVKVPEKVIDGYLIAELELQEKRIPFIIRRPLPNGGSEYWSIKDLENISF
jgi:DNA-directed RNA polymerase I, II, and III subunit RPABC2